MEKMQKNLHTEEEEVVGCSLHTHTRPSMRVWRSGLVVFEVNLVIPEEHKTMMALRRNSQIQEQAGVS